MGVRDYEYRSGIQEYKRQGFCSFVYGKRFSYGLQWVVGAAERLGGFKVLRYPEIPIHSFDYLLRGPRSGTNLRRP